MESIRIIVRGILKEELGEPQELSVTRAPAEEIQKKVAESDGSAEAFGKIYNEYVIQNPNGNYNALNVINCFQKLHPSTVASVIETEPYKSDYISRFGEYTYNVVLTYLRDYATNKEKYAHKDVSENNGSVYMGHKSSLPNSISSEVLTKEIIKSDGGEESFKKMYDEYVTKGRCMATQLIFDFDKIYPGVVINAMKSEPYKSAYLNSHGEYSYNVMLGFLHNTDKPNFKKS